MTRLPILRPIWCAQKAGDKTATQHDTEQAAINEWRHLGIDRAVMWCGSVVDERPEEMAA